MQQRLLLLLLIEYDVVNVKPVFEMTADNAKVVVEW
jgi:hypothetical protein